ncbi:MAG: ComEC/Rec2 family competence protein [Patescibacteria group bacterium]|nr:ComEC/Rec2 family competence protein [Patescibacteria group bacterium]
MHYSQVFLYFCVSFIFGIFVNSFFNLGLITIFGILIFGILLISVLWKYKKIAIIGFCLIFCAIGILRHQQADALAVNNELLKINNTNQEIILIGKIVSEPDIRETYTKLIVRPCQIQGKNYKNLGKVLIYADKFQNFQYNDELKIIGKMKTPDDSHFSFLASYKDYLAKDEIYSIIRASEIKILDNQKEKTDIFSEFMPLLMFEIYDFKDKMRDSIEQNLFPPQSLILGSIILGDKARISEQWKQKLNITGLRHITCISGMHIGILAIVLTLLALSLGLWRAQAFYFTAVLLSLFIIMTGFQTSAIRAGIMVGIFLFAQKIGRIRTAHRALIFAGVLMLIHNPLLLKSDIGFQLSFLAVLGIIYLTPFFENCFKFISIKFLRNILSASLSAQIFTLPILIYNFGYISIVGVFTNMLVIPVLPFILIFGFLLSFFGVFSSFLAFILSFPCYILLSYLILIIEKFSCFSYSYVNFNITAKEFLFFYLILCLIVWHFNIELKKKEILMP